MFILRITCATVVATLAAAASHARPLLIEESAILANPDPVRYPSFGNDVATNGTDILVVARDTTDEDHWVNYVLRWQRAGNQWVYRGEVLRQDTERTDPNPPWQIAMRGSLVVAALHGSAVAWRLTDAGLVNPFQLGGFTEDIEIEA